MCVCVCMCEFFCQFPYCNEQACSDLVHKTWSAVSYNLCIIANSNIKYIFSAKIPSFPLCCKNWSLWTLTVLYCVTYRSKTIKSQIFSTIELTKDDSWGITECICFAKTRHWRVTESSCMWILSSDHFPLHTAVCKYSFQVWMIV